MRKCLKTTSKLNEHINNDHPDGFESLDQITLDSRNDCSTFELSKCKECDKIFYSEADVEMHVTRVHKFGEYWNPYHCEECGFNGSDVIEIKEHQQNHMWPMIRLNLIRCNLCMCCNSCNL